MAYSSWLISVASFFYAISTHIIDHYHFHHIPCIHIRVWWLTREILVSISMELLYAHMLTVILANTCACISNWRLSTNYDQCRKITERKSQQRIYFNWFSIRVAPNFQLFSNFFLFLVFSPLFFCLSLSLSISPYIDNIHCSIFKFDFQFECGRYCARIARRHRLSHREREETKCLTSTLIYYSMHVADRTGNTMHTWKEGETNVVQHLLFRSFRCICFCHR